MTDRFNEGDRVMLLHDLYRDIDLDRGAIGTVWVEYQGEPPAYEVTFCDNNGKEFDLTVIADEIALAPIVQGVLEEVAA